MALPVGVLLAAGRGTRFDPSGARLKLLAPARSGPHAGQPLAVAAARNLRAVLPIVVAVLRPADSGLQRQLHALLAAEGCTPVVNAQADLGMASSLAAGIRAARALDAEAGWLVALADMPAIAPATIAAVAAAIAAGAATAAPALAGRRGYPVGFAPALHDELVALRGDEGARALLARHRPQLVAVDDPGILLDVDTAPD